MEGIPEAVRELANALGTTVEYLWPLMVKQQYVDPWYEVIVLGLCTLFTLPLLKWGNPAFLMILKNEEPSTKEEPKAGLQVAALFFGAIGLIVMAIFAGRVVSECVDLLNPEYAAFKDISELLGD